MSAEFFPSDNLTISLLSMLAVFGPSFIARPLGELFFGHIGSVRPEDFSLATVISDSSVPPCRLRFRG